jgi:hypothetical protein
MSEPLLFQQYLHISYHFTILQCVWILLYFLVVLIKCEVLLNWFKWCVGLHLIRMWCYFEMWINDDILCCLYFHSMKWANIIIVTSHAYFSKTWEYDCCWFQDNDLDVDVFSLLLDLKLCLYMSIDFFIGEKSMLYEIKCDCLCICRNWILWWVIHDA